MTAPPPQSQDDLGPELRWARRIVVSVVAGTLAVIGVALLVLPGPGTVVLLAALGLLATEFVWARRWLKRVRRTIGWAEPGTATQAGPAQGQEQRQAQDEAQAAETGPRTDAERTSDAR